MKFSSQLIISSLAAVALTACSGSSQERRQAKNDFTYLKAIPATKIKTLPDAQPHLYPDFDIPQSKYHGEIGKKVDIRPPQLVLTLIPNARLEQSQQDVVLWLSTSQDSDDVWQTVQNMIAQKKIKIQNQTDTQIETGWVTWISDDEDAEIGARYQVSRFEQNNRFGIKVDLIDWREDGKQATVNEANKARYNALMTNLIMSRYDYQVQKETQRKALALVKNIPLAMGTDRSGLPVIIARASYDVLWQKIPSILQQMGFTVEDKNRSQGSIETKYSDPGDDFWTKNNLKPIELDDSKYTLLLGDLENRTSINVTNSSGKPISEDKLTAFEVVLVKAVELDNQRSDKPEEDK